jgi:hypothetical protein
VQAVVNKKIDLVELEKEGREASSARSPDIRPKCRKAVADCNSDLVMQFVVSGGRSILHRCPDAFNLSASRIKREVTP